MYKKAPEQNSEAFLYHFYLSFPNHTSYISPNDAERHFFS